MKYMACSKCGREYRPCSVQKCKHPAVNRVYGKDICMYCCRKCPHNRKDGCGQVCGYKKITEERE